MSLDLRGPSGCLTPVHIRPMTVWGPSARISLGAFGQKWGTYGRKQGWEQPFGCLIDWWALYTWHMHKTCKRRWSKHKITSCKSPSKIEKHRAEKFRIKGQFESFYLTKIFAIFAMPRNSFCQRVSTDSRWRARHWQVTWGPGWVRLSPGSRSLPMAAQTVPTLPLLCNT